MWRIRTYTSGNKKPQDIHSLPTSQDQASLLESDILHTFREKLYFLGKTLFFAAWHTPAAIIYFLPFSLF